MTIFGDIVSRNQVETAVIETLHAWLPTYIAEVQRQTPGWDEALNIPQPRSFTSSNEFHKWPDDQLPCIVVICPGLRGTPVREGRGSYRARFAVGVAAVVTAAQPKMTRQIADMYAAAIRACLVQRPSLGGFASAVIWEDETTSDMPTSETRSVSSGQVIFTVEVEGVTTAQAGPTSVTVPPEDPSVPYAEWPLVETTNLEIELNEEEG